MTKRYARILSHRTLLAAEAVLLVGLAKSWLEGRLMALHVPPWSKVVFVMAATLGVLGGLILVMQKITTKGMARTHAAIRAIAVPVPYLVIHAAILFGIFLLYARSLGIRVF